MKPTQVVRGSLRTTRPSDKVLCYADGSKSQQRWSKSERDIVSRSKLRLPEPSTRHPLLDNASKEIGDYCASLPGSEEAEQCWLAYKFFNEETHSAVEECDLELAAETRGKGCNSVEHWEDFVRQAESFQGTKDTVHALYTLYRATENLKNRKTNETVHDIDERGSEDKKMHAALFRQMDRDQDGLIDTAEFRELMKKLGDELNGDTVSTIFNALEISCYLNLDQFLTIIEAEKVRAHTATAECLRRLGRHDVHRWWSYFPGEFS